MTTSVYHYIYNNPICSVFCNVYFSHPGKVCMSYLQHMLFSLYISKRLLVGSIHALVHAFYPDSYITSSSDLVEELSREMSAKGCK
jgi:hypothetical protein